MRRPAERCSGPSTPPFDRTDTGLLVPSDILPSRPPAPPLPEPPPRVDGQRAVVTGLTFAVLLSVVTLVTLSLASALVIVAAGLAFVSDGGATGFLPRVRGPWAGSEDEAA